MKIAVLLTENVHQVVLTPETKHERSLLQVFEGDKAVEIHTGHQFYYAMTRGGWMRQHGHSAYDSYDRSVMLVVQDGPVGEEQCNDAR